MNATTTTLYDDYLKLTNGDIAAAASLVLADALHSSIDAKTPAQTVPAHPVPDAMLISLKQAAAYLGYKPNGLREIVQRTKRSRAGVHVAGPTIEFSQAGKKGSLRFRRKWLDDFIEKNRDGRDIPLLPKPKSRKGPGRPAKATPEGEIWSRLCQ